LHHPQHHPPNVQYETITTDEQLRRLCDEIRTWESVAVDTEFVSERTFSARLCLIQLASPDGRLALIDAIAIDDLTPFWQTLADAPILTIVHAGQSEMEFSFRSVEVFPARLFDVQLASGFVGAEYPAGYANLVSRFLRTKTAKGETRTDWQKRPLSKHQIRYALDDVRHLHGLWQVISARLDELGRESWVEEETARMLRHIARSLGEDRWRRLGGVARLDGHGQAAARELWKWRDKEARRRNQPVRWILRDDLIIELARRGVTDHDQILSIRGLSRGDLRKRIDELAECVRRGYEMAEEDLPALRQKSGDSQSSVPSYAVLGQILFAALGNICRKMELAPALVATTKDVRRMIAHECDPGKKPTDEEHQPRLLQGWRADIIGNTLHELLAGKCSIRVADPKSDSPLAFECTSEDDS